MAKYRGAVIGLGWMGMLYDLAERPGPALAQPRFELESSDRPTPDLDVHRSFQQHEAHLRSGRPTSYAEAMADRSDVELVAAADRDLGRLNAFTERYGVESVYTDAMAMLEEVKPDLVAVATNIRGRADLTVAAVENGAKGIVTEKPMVNTLEEADRMVGACAEAGVPLSCGAITTTHPSFATAKELVKSGAIGEIVSIEAPRPGSQHQNWAYFLDADPAWAIGTGDETRHEGGSDEFRGQGMMVAGDGVVVHFRGGRAPAKGQRHAGRARTRPSLGLGAVAGRRFGQRRRAGHDALAWPADGPLRRHLLAGGRDRLHRGSAGRAQELGSQGRDSLRGGDCAQEVVGRGRRARRPAPPRPLARREFRLVQVEFSGTSRVRLDAAHGYRRRLNLRSYRSRLKLVVKPGELTLLNPSWFDSLRDQGKSNPHRSREVQSPECTPQKRR